MIYSVLVMPITNDAGRNIGGENALTTLGARTGGRVFAPNLGPGIDKAFTDILKELRTQYLLGFYPKNVPLNHRSVSQAGDQSARRRFAGVRRATGTMEKRRFFGT